MKRNNYIYQIVSYPGKAHLTARLAANDNAARRWLNDLCGRGVITGIPVVLQRYEGQTATPKKLTADWLAAHSTAANWVTI